MTYNEPDPNSRVCPDELEEGEYAESCYPYSSRDDDDDYDEAEEEHYHEVFCKYKGC